MDICDAKSSVLVEHIFLVVSYSQRGWGLKSDISMIMQNKIIKKKPVSREYIPIYI